MFKLIYRITKDGSSRRLEKFAGVLAVGFWLFAGSAEADTVTCAVASNFTSTLKEIVIEFEKTSGHSVRIVSGSTGKLFAQIMHGAPFDVFLSADTRRPRLLEKQQKVVPGSRFVYAKGQLVLWGHDSSRTGEDGFSILKGGNFKRISLANPKTAPYGQAAKEVLISYKLWNTLKPKMVRGENIGQAFQFVATGNADLGLVALSQVKDPRLINKGKFVLISSDLHTALEQEAVLLKASNTPRASGEFLEFLKNKSARAVMHRYGYLTE